MNRLARPPFLDPLTNIIYDTDQPEVEGYLTKQSMWIKDWRRRYFLLKGSKLFFAKTEYGAPHGMIDLATCTTVKSADLKSNKRNSFEISTAEMTFLLYADTEKEKDDWIGSVGRSIVRCSSTYYRSGSQQQQQQRGGGESGTRADLRTQSSGQGRNQQYENDEDGHDNSDDYSNDSNNPYFN